MRMQLVGISCSTEVPSKARQVFGFCCQCERIWLGSRSNHRSTEGDDVRMCLCQVKYQAARIIRGPDPRLEVGLYLRCQTGRAPDVLPSDCEPQLGKGIQFFAIGCICRVRKGGEYKGKSNTKKSHNFGEVLNWLRLTDLKSWCGQKGKTAVPAQILRWAATFAPVLKGIGATCCFQKRQTRPIRFKYGKNAVGTGEYASTAPKLSKVMFVFQISQALAPVQTSERAMQETPKIHATARPRKCTQGHGMTNKFDDFTA